VANVKGSALSSRVLWVQLGHGAAGLAKLRAVASPQLRETLDAGVSKARWYPLRQFFELNTLIDRLFGKGDLSLVKELGRHGADANLTTIYRLFYKVGTAQWILGRAVRLWSAHYDTGFLEVLTRGSRHAILRIHGFALPDPVHCLSVAGWCERSIELSGGWSVFVTETRCRTRGDELCQLEATWE
jgi:type IV secretory pathway TrbD component